MQIEYNDKIININKNQKVIDIFRKEIEKNKNNIIACRFNNEIKSLDYEINENGKIELLDLTNKDGMRVYRRGLIYIVAKAFEEIYKEALITVNYQLYHSLFCEVTNMEMTEEIIEKVDERLKQIVKQDLPITKKFMTKKQAQKFYEKEKTIKGLLQLNLKEKDEVTLYYCEDYYNYFYGVMPISTGCMKAYELVKYEQGFLLRYPSRKNPHKITDFKEGKKLFKTLEDYEEIHKILKINTLNKLNKIIQENKIKDYILLDEALHEKKIANIADNISKNTNLKVILIAGPSSSGKTTFAKRIELQLLINRIKTFNNFCR